MVTALFAFVCLAVLTGTLVYAGIQIKTHSVLARTGEPVIGLSRRDSLWVRHQPPLTAKAVLEQFGSTDYEMDRERREKGEYWSSTTSMEDKIAAARQAEAAGRKLAHKAELRQSLVAQSLVALHVREEGLAVAIPFGLDEPLGQAVVAYFRYGFDEECRALRAMPLPPTALSLRFVGDSCVNWGVFVHPRALDGILKPAPSGIGGFPCRSR